MDQTLLDVLSSHGLSDFSCNKIVFGEADESLSTPAEKEFYEILKGVMAASDEVVMYDKESFPSAPMGFGEAMQMRTLFSAINVIKVLRTVGLKVGPSFIDDLPFPFWRHKVWSCNKVDKCFSFIGIPKPDRADLVHPIDYARSTRYNNCVSIRETEDRDTLLCEDYGRQHLHGLRGIASLMSLSFIEVDPQTRVFRMYCIQGCSRLYSWDELKNDRRVQEEIKAKIMVKGRIPRTRDFKLKLRTAWEEAQAGQVGIEQAQQRLLKCMLNLAPLLPIKLSVPELVKYVKLDIGPIILAQFLDGRTGMSYGFLAYQLPSGPAESCDTVRVLCTRSGCDKQKPHPMDDWVVLSCNTTDIELEGSAALQNITSPSFDSWLILSQAAANVALAKRLKAAGRCASYVNLVENEGLALCHFHGFIQQDALPKNMAFFGQDRLPLPCGSVESAYLTVQEKRQIGEKLLTTPLDFEYEGDVHVEPDHGSVVSCRIELLDRLTRPDVAAYGLGNFKTYRSKRSDEPFLHWSPQV